MRVAVIGLGSAGSRHSELLAELGHEVVGHDPAVASEPSFEAAIAGADAVVIASPSSLHAEQACAALAAGRRVLVEKPLAVDPAGSARVLAAGGECGVAMNLRFHPGVLRLRELVQSGDLGEIRAAHVALGWDLRQWRPQQDYRGTYSAQAALGGGIVLDSIHEIDYLQWLLGPVAEVAAEVDHLSDLETDVEDIAVALLRMRSGALVTLHLDELAPAYRRECTLIGSERVARWDWVTSEVVVRRAGQAEWVIGIPADVRDTYRAVLEDFLAGPPRTSAEEGHAAVLVADAIKRSAREGRRVTVGG
jgi:predicted dehydrogenase